MQLNLHGNSFYTDFLNKIQQGCSVIYFDYIFIFICRQHYGDKHPTYADSLVDYGFYLLNVDSVNSAVKIYQVCETLFVFANSRKTFQTFIFVTGIVGLKTT